MLDRNKSNPKKFWKMIRRFWPGKKGAFECINFLANKTKDIDKANELNEHFCTAGLKIQDGIVNNNQLNDFIPIHHPPIFDLNNVRLEEVAKAIGKLNNTQSSSMDGITAYMLQSGKAELLLHLHFFI